MTRLFAGTPWDRPPTCDRCGELESRCSCPPPVGAHRIPSGKTDRPAATQETAQGKVVTVIAALDPDGNDLPALAGRLKTECGTGGTLKDDLIELQGDHLKTAATILQKIGYKTRQT